MVANRSLERVNSLFTTIKDQSPIIEKSDVIYEIKCVDYEKLFIGITSWDLKYRITTHKSDTKPRSATCALAKHVEDTGHVPDFKNVRILDNEFKCFKRSFVEMAHIHCHSNTMSKNPIHRIYLL